MLQNLFNLILGNRLLLCPLQLFLVLDVRDYVVQVLNLPSQIVVGGTKIPQRTLASGSVQESLRAPSGPH